jgi:hypothetical protein
MATTSELNATQLGPRTDPEQFHLSVGWWCCPLEARSCNMESW